MFHPTLTISDKPCAMCQKNFAVHEGSPRTICLECGRKHVFDKDFPADQRVHFLTSPS